VEVKAASLNAYDWHFLSADIFLIRLMGGGLFKPRNPWLGADIAGRVETLGRNIQQFRPGDEVFGDIGSFGDTPQPLKWRGFLEQP
jgi:NADPH:quinone reductase-like Zn-dependent oxidoreductase